MEEVLAKYFSGNATKDEISSVETWRSESEENAKAFYDSKLVWLSSGKIEDAPSHILEQIIDKPQAKQVSFLARSWVRYASAAILVLAISLLFVLNRNTSEINYSDQSLSDGSVVSLHGDARVEVLNFNKDIREVRVYGKAYFDIERDENRPFVIHTSNATVKVLGTSFVVDAVGSKTEVLVESGLVELLKSGKNEVSVKLAKGEMGLVDNNNEGIIKRNNSDLNYLAWKTKIITFNQSSMAEVQEVIEEVYGINMKFENPNFKNCKLTAKFNKKKARDAIEIIARTFNVQYEYSSKEAVLKGKGC
ncbi:MAG: FecR domain-containing protein [Ekhidna sp.]|uniref:FecR family protein n=1 Tax=Ekhidna sp. TaxID=2608089 RepID=UPI0032ECF1D6